MTARLDDYADLIAAHGGAIPRAIMPQIDEADYPALLDFLRGRGVVVTLGAVAPETLRFAQEADVFIPGAMPKEVEAKPILIASDHFVLDGNHRGQAHVSDGSAAPAYRLSVGFAEGFNLLCAFAGVYTIGAKGNDLSRN